MGLLEGLGCFVKDFNWDPYDGVDLVWEDCIEMLRALASSHPRWLEEVARFIVVCVGGPSDFL